MQLTLPLAILPIRMQAPGLRPPRSPAGEGFARGRPWGAALPRWGLLLLSLVPSLALAAHAPAQVASHQKISALQGGFTGTLQPDDRFGASVAGIGDIDNDGVVDLAVGADGTDYPGKDQTGAVWVLLMNSNGTVKSNHKLPKPSELHGGSVFGYSVASLGDLNDDGTNDLAIGAYADYNHSQGISCGAVYVAFLSYSGSAVTATYLKISDGLNGLPGGQLGNGVNFGSSVAGLEDLNGDGFEDLAVGAMRDGAGAVWVLFLSQSGAVTGFQRITPLQGTLWFGSSLAALDFDGDGLSDLAVGAARDSDSGVEKGAVYLLLLDQNGGVNQEYKISATQGGFPGSLLQQGDWFGGSVACTDLDCNEVPDLAVGAQGDDDGGTDRGAVWLLFMNANGTVQQHAKISSTQGGFTGTLSDGDLFGSSVTAPADYDDNCALDLAVGARYDSDGGTHTGALWVLFMTPCVPVPSIYCTAKTNSLGCNPFIAYAGTPSVSSFTPFDIEAFNIVNDKNGLLFYGFGPKSLPFQGGYLCVNPPIKRTAVQNSGHAAPPPPPNCTGSYSYNFNARIQSGVDPSLVQCTTVYAQYWYRDPQSPSTTGLTNALRFAIGP